MTDEKTGRALYGFGAAADAVGYVPGLRNIMGWLSAGSASYKVLKAGITKVCYILSNFVIVQRALFATCYDRPGIHIGISPFSAG